jgi:hypothetical protein
MNGGYEMAKEKKQVNKKGIKYQIESKDFPLLQLWH